MDEPTARGHPMTTLQKDSGTTLIDELLQAAQVLDAARLIGQAKMLRARAAHIDSLRDDLLHASKAVVEHHRALTGPLAPPGGTAGFFTTATGTTCAACGSLLIPQPAGNVTELRCVNCRRSAEREPPGGG